MLLLGHANPILEELLMDKVEAKKHDGCDIRLCDFDDVTYRVVQEKKDPIVNVHMHLPAYEATKGSGAEDVLKGIYGDMLVTPDGGEFNLGLRIDVSNLAEKGDVVAKKVAMFKANAQAAIFRHFFGQLHKKEDPSKPFRFSLRPDTEVFICPTKERVTVVFSVDFSEKTDLAIARIFLEELREVRRKLGAAPPASFNVNPPEELKQFGINEPTGGLGFVSVSILPGHVSTEAKVEKAALNMQIFRSYLQYHLKCCKSHFHARMRARVRSLLKVLNRAKTVQEEGAKKTASGRTFSRK